MKRIKNIPPLYYYIAGLLAVFIGFLPCMLLGKGGVYMYWEQLDGGIFPYILHVRHLSTGGAVYPELMNGIAKEGMQLNAPLLALLFYILPPMQAFLLGSILIAAVGFAGMFACVSKITDNKIIAWIVGCIFAYTPFYAVYGISVMGVPLLLYAFWGLYKREHIVRNMALTAFFGFMSSLVLVGYVCLGILGVAFLVLFFGKAKGKKKEMSWFAAGLVLLTGIYLLCNLSLLVKLFGFGEAAFVSHREEIVMNAVPMADTLKELLTDGAMHAKGLQKYMLLPIGMAVLCGALFYKKLEKKEKGVFWVLLAALTLNLVLALFSAVYKSAPVVEIRNRAGGIIKYTQFDRGYFMMPAFWYIAFGAALHLLWVLLARWKRPAAFLVTGCFVAVTGAYVLWNSSFKSNVRQIVNPATSNAMTWEKFYDEELFASIDTYIGRPKEEYRVLSLGIDPAAALYNGFYCLDGYSNNYDINYKHQFRKIMEKEIEKSEYLKAYFDDWGNRCYLFAAQLEGNYYISKDSGLVLENFSMDTAQAKEMGCEYLFSGLEIADADNIGLEFLDSFETEKGFYRIWLYRLK